MDIKNIQQYYSSVFYSLRRNGLKNKLLLIILSIPAVFYAYYDVNARYQYYDWDYPHECLYYLCGVLLVIILLAILTINTISFVNSQRVRGIRKSFKKELFECISEQIPEIQGYCYNKKIHPKYFKDSGLYKSTHTDYIGDDLFNGEYKCSKFEICELHVFKLFKQIFDGLFIRIQINLSSIQSKEVDACLVSTLSMFKETYNINVKVSNSNVIYVAVKHHGKFFEQSNLREIGVLGDDIIVLSDVVKLTKGIINCCQQHV
jgi:hypothetical protein